MQSGYETRQTHRKSYYLANEQSQSVSAARHQLASLHCKTITVRRTATTLSYLELR